MHATQGDTGGEEGEDTAEGAAAAAIDRDEDEGLSPLVRILPDKSSIAEDNIYRLVLSNDMR